MNDLLFNLLYNRFKEQSKEKTAIKKILPYLIVILLNFYLLPLMIGDTGSAMVILLMSMPAVCLICSLVYGAKNSFNPVFPILVGVLFVPAVFIFFNESAWVYILTNSIISFASMLAGAKFLRRL